MGKKPYIIGIFLIFLFILNTGLFYDSAKASSSADYEVKSENVAYDDSYSHTAYGLEKDDHVKVTVSASTAVDIYIMSNNQYWSNYLFGNPFSPLTQQLNTTSADINFKVPDDQLYYVVIDNTYRGYPGEAIPTTNVVISVSLKVTNSPSDTSLYGFCFGVIILIIVIIAVLIYFLIIRKKKTQQNYQQQQQPGYPQYQQYPSLPQYQYPQQPPQYQPPPYQPPPCQPPSYPPPQ